MSRSTQHVRLCSYILSCGEYSAQKKYFRAAFYAPVKISCLGRVIARVLKITPKNFIYLAIVYMFSKEQSHPIYKKAVSYLVFMSFYAANT